MHLHPNHEHQIKALKRIEGQIRGIQKMIVDRKYCIDIITQLHATVGAVLKVEDEILETHLNGCVTNALEGKSKADKQTKIKELVALIKKFRNF